MGWLLHEKNDKNKNAPQSNASLKRNITIWCIVFLNQYYIKLKLFNPPNTDIKCGGWPEVLEKFLARDYSLTIFAHSISPKSVLEWFLLAEQIIICHYDQKRLVPFEKERKKPSHPTPPIRWIFHNFYRVQIAVSVSCYWHVSTRLICLTQTFGITF